MADRTTGYWHPDGSLTATADQTTFTGGAAPQVAGEAGAPEAQDEVPDVRAASSGLTIAQLLDVMRAAFDRMGTNNPNRNLLMLAAQVIVQQTRRVAELEQQQAQAEQPRIILPGS